MTIHTYRKKPVTIEALQWDGYNADECYSWAVLPSEGPVSHAVVQCFVPLDCDEADDQFARDQMERFVANGATAGLWVKANDQWLGIVIGEWIAKDRHGFYPIKDDVFLESYDKVD